MKFSSWRVLILGILFCSCSLPEPMAKSSEAPASPPTLATAADSAQATIQMEVLQDGNPPTKPLSEDASLWPDPRLTELLTINNIANLEQVARIGSGFIHDVAVSPDQTMLAVYVGAQIDVYDTETFHLKQSHNVGKYVTNSSVLRLDNWKLLTFTSDNSRLIFSDGRWIYFWDLTNPNERVTNFSSQVPEWSVVDLSLSPNEDRIVVTTMGGGCDGRALNFALYDLVGRLIFNLYTCADYSNNFYRFTHDQKILFIFASIMTDVYPSQTFLIDAATGTLLENTRAEYLDHRQPIPDLKLLYDISPNGEFLAYAIYNRVDESLTIRTEVVHFETQQLVHEQEGLVEFFVDGFETKWRAQADNTDIAETDAGICNTNHPHTIDEYTLLSSGKNQAIFALNHFGTVQSIERWDIADCTLEETLFYPAADHIIFSPDGQLLAGTDGFHAYVWDVQTGSLQFMAAGEAFENPKNIIQFNADGSRFMAGPFGLDFHSTRPYQTYTISVFDTLTGQQIRELNPDSDFLKDIVATPERDLVIIQDSIKRHVWNIESGKILTTLPLGPAAFAPESGYIWIVPQHEGERETPPKIILYNYHTGEQVRELVQLPDAWVRNIYRDSSGTNLLGHLFHEEGENFGDEVFVFDVAHGGERLHSFKLPPGVYNMIAFGNFFATYGSNGHVQLWEYNEASPVLTLTGGHLNRQVSDRFQDAKERDGWASTSTVGNHIDSIFFDESMLITQGDSLRFWGINNGSLLAETRSDYIIKTISVSPNQTLIAVAGEDGIIRFWGVLDGS